MGPPGKLVAALGIVPALPPCRLPLPHYGCDSLIPVLLPAMDSPALCHLCVPGRLESKECRLRTSQVDLCLAEGFLGETLSITWCNSRPLSTGPLTVDSFFW